MNSHLYRALVLISSVNYAISVLPEFCQLPLNKDDCNLSPKPVFSYYHPESHCKIEFWRGCPTRNMFYDETTCSSVCIYKLYSGAESGKSSHISEADKNGAGGISLLNNPCFEHYTHGDCGKPKQTKYYFAGNRCIRTEWTGCESNNLFDNLPACIIACNPVMYFEGEIKEVIKYLTKKKINDEDKMIDHAIQDELKDSESPFLNSKLSENEANNWLMDHYNDTSDEYDNYYFSDNVSYDNGQYVESLSAEHANEPEKLAASDDSEEGSQEEVFALS